VAGVRIGAFAGLARPSKCASRAGYGDEQAIGYVLREDQLVVLA